MILSELYSNLWSIRSIISSSIVNLVKICITSKLGLNLMWTSDCLLAIPSKSRRQGSWSWVVTTCFRQSTELKIWRIGWDSEEFNLPCLSWAGGQDVPASLWSGGHPATDPGDCRHHLRCVGLAAAPGPRHPPRTPPAGQTQGGAGPGAGWDRCEPVTPVWMKSMEGSRT